MTNLINHPDFQKTNHLTLNVPDALFFFKYETNYPFERLPDFKILETIAIADADISLISGEQDNMQLLHRS